MELEFRKLGTAERVALAPARGEVWHGHLTIDEFVRRNARLYAHEYGRTRMHTFGLCDANGPHASLDALEMPLLVGDGKGGVQPVLSWHIASVLTLPQHRGKGLASHLLNTYLEGEKPAWSTLFSGIGAAFYESFGYRASDAWEYFLPSKAGSPALWSAKESDRGTFAHRQAELRSRALQEAKEPAAAFNPGELWWHWYGDIYQYFAEVRGASAPNGRFWEVQADGETVWVAAAENRPAGNLDVWWLSTENAGVLEFLRDQAYRLGLKGISWWSSQERAGAGAQKRVPMLWSAQVEGSLPLLDTQLGDWW